MQDRYDDEVEYWRAVLSSLGDGSATDALRQRYQDLLNPDLPVAPEIAAILREPADGCALKVLDVGCGPLTVLGKRWGNTQLEITGVDPLADQYQSMLRTIGVTPPMEMRRGFGEEVDRYFEHNTFDFVYSRNAIDHSQQPHIAIRSMLRVARPGSAVWINVNRNEAINAAYNGLHSWNFDELHDTLVIWNPSQSMLLEQIVDGLPFRWRITQIAAKKICPQEIDILIFKDGTDLRQMTEAAPGLYASITGQGEFLTIWMPSDTDERFNMFVHGYTADGRIIFNRSFRWYNSVRRRSLSVPNMAEIDHFQFGQFDVTFTDGKPVYRNLYVGRIPAR